MKSSYSVNKISDILNKVNREIFFKLFRYVSSTIVEKHRERRRVYLETAERIRRLAKL